MHYEYLYNTLFIKAQCKVLPKSSFVCFIGIYGAIDNL